MVYVGLAVSKVGWLMSPPANIEWSKKTDCQRTSFSGTRFYHKVFVCCTLHLEKKMKNDTYQKIGRQCRIMFTFLGIVSVMPSGCGKKDSLGEDIEKLGRASGPVSPESQLRPPELADRGTNAKVYEGIVQETIPVSRYTYIRLKEKTGSETWAAVPRTEIPVGETVEVRESIVMTDFKSPGLGRTFPSIVFGVLGEAGSGDGITPPVQGKGNSQQLPPGHPPVDDVTDKMMTK